MSEQRHAIRELRFDLKSMRDRACVGVRRAAAFLGLSERFMEADFPRSLTLGKNVKRQFLPDPFPTEHIAELRENWQAWIIGNALRELDQFLSLYLDEAYDIVQQAKLVSGEHPPHHQWKRIDQKTNVADKHKLVLEEAKRFAHSNVDDHACLVSLSHARNCLSHDLGIVTHKRATNGELTVRWLAIRTLLEQDGQIIDLDMTELPVQVGPNGSAVLAKIEIVERKFKVADHIRFTPDELLGICLFYQIVIDRVLEAVQEYAQQCGVVFAPISVKEQ